VAYLLDIVPGQPRLTPAQQALSELMVRSWARFAATGDPNGGTDPPWPAWSGDGTVRTLTPDPLDGARPGSAFAADHRCALWPAA
jgi:para-nitrobenzyl esterase